MEPIEKVGRVIAVAGSIETLLSLHGASGTGLREKTESLAGKLPPEALELSRRIGLLRNRVAHEPDAEISDAELEAYEEDARKLALVINALNQTDAPAPQAPPPAVPETDASAPKPPVRQIRYGKAPQQKNEKGEERSAKPVNRPFYYWSLVPGVHVVFLLSALFSSFLTAGWFLILLLTFPAGCVLGYRYRHVISQPPYWFWTGIGIIAAGYVLTLLTAFFERKAFPRLWKTALVPAGHLVYLAIRIVQKVINSALFLPIAAALTAQAAACWVFWDRQEYLAGVILTVGSVIAAFLVARYRQLKKG